SNFKRGDQRHLFSCIRFLSGSSAHARICSALVELPLSQLLLLFHFSNDFCCDFMIFFSNWMICLINGRRKNIFFFIWLLQWQVTKHLCFQCFSYLFSTAFSKDIFSFACFFASEIWHILDNTSDLMVCFPRHLSGACRYKCCGRMWCCNDNF